MEVYRSYKGVLCIVFTVECTTMCKDVQRHDELGLFRTNICSRKIGQKPLISKYRHKSCDTRFDKQDFIRLIASKCYFSYIKFTLFDVQE